MATTISTTELCWIRTRALPTKLVRDDGTPKLGRAGSYAAAWTGGGAWEQPWVGDTSHSRYWERTLRANYRAARAHDAFGSLVPLAHHEPLAVIGTGAAAGVNGRLRRYVSPLGVAVELRITVPNPTGAVDTLTALTRDIVRTPLLAITPAAPAPLRKLLEEQVDALEQLVSRRSDPDAETDPDIVSIAVCTETTDWGSAAPADGDALHQLLDDLARFPGTAGARPALAPTLLAPSSSFPATTRLMNGTGCVIWSPGNVATDRGRWHLTCYLRNVSLALMQAELAINALRWAVRQKVMTFDIERIIKRAVVGLSLAYGQASDGYSSEFVRRYIADRKAVVDQARVVVGLTPLQP